MARLVHRTRSTAILWQLRGSFASTVASKSEGARVGPEAFTGAPVSEQRTVDQETKRPRRSAGEGAIYETADGRLRGSVLVDLPDGGQKRVYVSGRTRADVVRKLDAKRKESAAGAVTGETLGEYLARWIVACKPRLRPATHTEYARHVAQYWAALARTPLTRLRPLDVEQRLGQLLERGLSPQTVRHARSTLRRALNDAIREGILNRNAAALARPPRVIGREMRALSPSEAGRLLSATSDDPWGPLYAVALGTGCRLGELLGLSWDDLAEDGASIVVRRSLAAVDNIDPETGKRRRTWRLAEPKTAKSRRTVMLPTIAIEALRRQKARQAAARLAAGAAWQDQHHLIFTDALGRPARPDNVSGYFRAAVDTLGLPHVRFHDLRHSAATLMLSQGVPLKVVSETLGHSSIAITADVYQHVTPDLRREAAPLCQHRVRHPATSD
jgi:integrase